MTSINIIHSRELLCLIPYHEYYYLRFITQIVKHINRSNDLKTLPEYVWSKLEVANQLRLIMRQRFLTQDKWAEKAEIGLAHLNRILSCQTLPRLDTLIKIAESVNCRVEIRIVTKKPTDNQRFEELANAYWECDFAKFTPDELKLLRQYYMISQEQDQDVA